MPYLPPAGPSKATDVAGKSSKDVADKYMPVSNNLILYDCSGSLKLPLVSGCKQSRPMFAAATSEESRYKQDKQRRSSGRSSTQRCLLVGNDISVILL